MKFVRLGMILQQVLLLELYNIRCLDLEINIFTLSDRS